MLMKMAIYYAHSVHLSKSQLCLSVFQKKEAKPYADVEEHSQKKTFCPTAVHCQEHSPHPSLVYREPCVTDFVWVSVIWAICENAGSASPVLRWGPRFCIFRKLRSANTAGAQIVF